MPISGLSVGRDYQFGIFDQNSNTIVDLGVVETVKVTANKTDIKAMPYNSDPIFGYIPDGYKISFSLKRTGATLENLSLALQELFRSGKPINSGYFNEVVTNPDGSISRYVYEGFVFWLTEVADVSREKNVAQTVEAMASFKRQVA